MVETELELSFIFTRDDEYTINVSAVNSIGEGPASSPVVYMPELNANQSNNGQLNIDQCKFTCASC